MNEIHDEVTPIVWNLDPGQSSLTPFPVGPDKTGNEWIEQAADHYCSLALSDLAAMKMGISGSASFQGVRKS